MVEIFRLPTDSYIRMKDWMKNETHPLRRVGWKKSTDSLPTRRHTHATTCATGGGRAKHVVRIKAGTDGVNRGGGISHSGGAFNASYRGQLHLCSCTRW